MLPSPADLAPILADLELSPGAASSGGVRVAPAAEAAAAARALRDGGLLLVAVEGAPAERELVRLRAELWPACHAVGLYRSSAQGLARRSVAGEQRLGERLPFEGVLIAARTRARVMSPEVTTTKFDANAAGWNGEPGTPGYGHFRWMRRFVGTFARVPDGARVLDFGCGAGWVGIEAALSARDVELALFDPSPEMVRVAAQNAAAQGLERFAARVGFGEDPPFPAEGEPPFDVVISSGVLSFSPDLDRWLAGLVRTVRRGGTLVVGDLNPRSRGMRRRRETHALLPVRELNARTAAEVRERLERLGLRHERTSGYQLSRPVPQVMHLSERKLGGALSPALLLANRAAAGLERALGDPFQGLFDSWVSRYACARG